MKKLWKVLICFAIIATYSFSFYGCNNNKTVTETKEWTTTAINNTNVSEYFELGGYLGYKFNNGTGSMGSPWADNYYYKVLGVTYLKHKEYYTDKSSELDLSLSDFFSLQSSSTKNYLKWQVVILKAKEDMQIDTLKLRSYFSDEVDIVKAHNSNINLQFTIKKQAPNYSEINPILNTIGTYTIKPGYYDQTYVMDKEHDNSPDNHYHDLILNKEYYGAEIYEWNNRTILLKKNQYFCMEFTNVEQIEPTFSAFGNYSDIEAQVDLDFAIEDISYSVKVER